ncbi:hypothetical protein MKW98_014671, partial [Papaver atlanticum]
IFSPHFILSFSVGSPLKLRLHQNPNLQLLSLFFYYQILPNNKKKRSEKTYIGSASSSVAIVNKLVGLAATDMRCVIKSTRSLEHCCGLYCLVQACHRDLAFEIWEDLFNYESSPYLVGKGELMFTPLAFNATYISCVLSSSQGKRFEAVYPVLNDVALTGGSKKKKEESSSEEESSFDDEVPVTKQVAANKSKPESSSSESDLMVIPRKRLNPRLLLQLKRMQLLQLRMQISRRKRSQVVMIVLVIQALRIQLQRKLLLLHQQQRKGYMAQMREQAGLDENDTRNSIT